MGSIGHPKYRVTGGGGRIVIKTDSLHLNTPGVKLEANGLPLASYKAGEPPFDNLKGGSGGYIYIKTYNKMNANNIHNEANLTVVGGHGVGERGGGSGGGVVLDGGLVIDPTQVDASGGTSDFSPYVEEIHNSCSNGAAGTLWYRHEDRLVVDNKGKKTEKKTRILAPWGSQREGLPHLIAKDIVLVGKSQSQIRGEHNFLAFENLHMREGAILSLER